MREHMLKTNYKKNYNSFKDGKELFAVYGTLREGFGNHKHFLKNQKLIDKTVLNGFDMYAVSYGFPGIKEGNGKIVVEIYEVEDQNIKRNLDRLEGYNMESDTGLFIRRKVKTPHGKAWIYYWGANTHGVPFIESGDFYEFKMVK